MCIYSMYVAIIIHSAISYNVLTTELSVESCQLSRSRSNVANHDIGEYAVPFSNLATLLIPLWIQHATPSNMHAHALSRPFSNMAILHLLHNSYWEQKVVNVCACCVCVHVWCSAKGAHSERYLWNINVGAWHCLLVDIILGYVWSSVDVHRGGFRKSGGGGG